LRRTAAIPGGEGIHSLEARLGKDHDRVSTRQKGNILVQLGMLVQQPIPVVDQRSNIGFCGLRDRNSLCHKTFLRALLLTPAAALSRFPHMAGKTSALSPDRSRTASPDWLGPTVCPTPAQFHLSSQHTPLPLPLTLPYDRSANPGLQCRT